MRLLLIILSVCFFSCLSKKKKPKVTWNYVQKELTSSISKPTLPAIENGITFKPVDSVYYLNLFIPNDSTIEVGGKQYVYSLDSIFSIKMYWYEDEKDTVVEELKSVFQKQLKEVNSEQIEVNFFCDSSINMKFYEKIRHALSSLSSNKIKYLNIMGSSGKYVQVNYSKTLTYMPGCMMSRGRNILSILANYKNELMVEYQSGVQIDTISAFVRNFYMNKNDQEYPLLEEYDRQTIITRIVIYSDRLKKNPNLLSYQKKIEEWNNKLDVYKVLGEYMMLPKRSYIHIKTDSKTKFTIYTKILNEINRTVCILKDNYVREKFNLSYYDLLQGNRYKKIREAVDFIFPTKIYPLTRYPIYIPKPPPPPPLP